MQIYLTLWHVITLTNCIASRENMSEKDLKLHHLCDGYHWYDCEFNTYTLFGVCAVCNRRTRIETRMMIFKLSCYLYQFTSKYIYICICTINFNKILVKNGWNAANNNKTKTMNNFSAKFIRFGIEVENNLKITCLTLNCMHKIWIVCKQIFTKSKYTNHKPVHVQFRIFIKTMELMLEFFFYFATAR